MALPAVGSVQDRGPRSVVWADVAKGVCIILVVLHHLVGKHYVNVLPDRLDGLAATWNALTYKLKPVRLPLFFLISGFFAANALRRPWREVWPTRVGNLYYLYALWLCIHAVLFAQLTQLPMNRTQSATDLIGDLVLASTGLWYLYALVAYFLAVRLLRDVDPRAVLVVAVALALAVPWLDIAATNRASLLQHFVYFVLGAYFPSAVERMTHLGRVQATRLAVAAVLLTGVGALAHIPSAVMVLPVSLLGVPCCVAAAVALARRPALAGVLASLGRRTLPIYVLHVPFLAVVHLVVASRVSVSEPWLVLPAVAVYPVVLTLMVVAACLALQWALEAMGALALFNGPLSRPQPTEPAVVNATGSTAMTKN